MTSNEIPEMTPAEIELLVKRARVEITALRQVLGKLRETIVTHKVSVGEQYSEAVYSGTERLERSLRAELETLEWVLNTFDTITAAP